MTLSHIPCLLLGGTPPNLSLPKSRFLLLSFFLSSRHRKPSWAKRGWGDPGKVLMESDPRVPADDLCDNPDNSFPPPGPTPPPTSPTLENVTTTLWWPVSSVEPAVWLCPLSFFLLSLLLVFVLRFSSPLPQRPSRRRSGCGPGGLADRPGSRTQSEECMGTGWSSETLQRPS